MNIHPIKAKYRQMVNDNELETYEPEFIKIYKENFGKDYKRHIYNYFVDNKLLPEKHHFIQLVNILVLFYGAHGTYSSDIIQKDVSIFTKDLEDAGYYLTEEDALFCTRYNIFLKDFKIVDKKGKSYDRLCMTIATMLIDGMDVPDYIIENLDNDLITSYHKIKTIMTVTQMKDMFTKYNIIPNYNHRMIFSNNKIARKVDKNRIIKYFTKKGIDI
jgi:hypothetical protein